MLYDELVPDGKYLAHYGIPKDQWSPAARAKYDREHGGNNNSYGSKVDEYRYRRAVATRRYEAEDRRRKPSEANRTTGRRQESRTKPQRETSNPWQKPKPAKNDDYKKPTKTGVTNTQKPAHPTKSGKTSRSSYKPETTNEYSLSSNAKHSPEFDDAVRQMNAVDYAINRSGRNLREYSHNGQLVKQNPSLNRVAEFEGMAPNRARVVTKGRKKSKSRRN